MPKTNIPVGKVMSKPRSQWGTVIPDTTIPVASAHGRFVIRTPWIMARRCRSNSSHIKSTRLMCGWRTSIIWSIYIPKASKRGFIPVTA